MYQDPLLGIFDRHIEDLDLDTERYYQDLADRLEICRKHTPAYDTLFAFYHSLASTLAGKADLGVRLKKAYDAHDLSTLETICEEVIPRNHQRSVHNQTSARTPLDAGRKTFRL